MTKKEILNKYSKDYLVNVIKREFDIENMDSFDFYYYSDKGYDFSMFDPKDKYWEEGVAEIISYKDEDDLIETNIENLNELMLKNG